VALIYVHVDIISHSSKLVLKVKHKVAVCVMEGSMVFCQENILEHFMNFRGDYVKGGCSLRHRVNKILLLVTNGLFSTLV
jgi:hypothetical protein